MNMRKFKFRCWEKDDRLMHSAVVVQPDDFVGIPVVGPDGWQLEKRKWHNVVVMQYTGLKDKNGKEIYEGDVFEVTDGDEWVIETHQAKIDGETLSIDERCIGKLLGNIHENPELLK